MKTIEVEVLQRLFASMANGHIRPEHLEALLRDPNAVLERLWSRKPVMIMPKNERRRNFCVTESNLAYIVNLDGHDQVFSDGCRGGIFDSVSHLSIAAGKPLYVGKQGDYFRAIHGAPENSDGSKSAYYHVGAAFPMIFDLSLSGIGLPLYRAQLGERHMCIVHGVEELGHCESIGSVAWVENNILASVRQGNRHYAIVGTDRSDWYGGMKCLSLKNGAVLFAAKPEQGRVEDRWFVVGGARVLLDQHDDIDSLMFADDGTPVYAAKDRERWRVWKNGNQISDDHAEIRELQMVAGVPLFIAGFPGGNRVIHGQKIWPEYAQIHSLLWVGNRPLFAATRDKKKWFVVYGGVENGLSDEVFSLSVVDDRIIYGERKGRTLYRVIMEINN